jgi:hypothetical protein
MTTSLMIDACPRTNHDPVQGELIPSDGSEAGVAFLPSGMCAREEPLPQPARRLPAQPKISWLGLLCKLLWRKLSA